MTDENKALRRIINSEVVYQHFGYWPDFHDAEVVKVAFETHPATGRYSVTFRVVAFEMTSEVDELGYYRHTKQCEIDFQFTGVEKMDFDFFSHQNVLFELKFEEQDNSIKAVFDSSTGLNAMIVAEEVLMLSLKVR